MGAYFSFALRAPYVDARFDSSVEALVTSMQFTSGMLRAMSPVAGMTIAVARAASISPMAVVCRTWSPMLAGMVTALVANAILFD